MDDIVFASTLIWYHTYRQTHTEQKGDNKLTHTYKYILTPPAMKTEQLPVSHLINSLLIKNLLYRYPQ